jgi:hypothetical protein
MLADMLPEVERRALHALANRKAPMPSADQAMTTRAMLRNVHRQAMARRAALAELGVSEDLITGTQREASTGRFTSPVTVG